jgi:hypothetical protein
MRILWGLRFFGAATAAIVGTMIQVSPDELASNLSKWWSFIAEPPDWVRSPFTDDIASMFAVAIVTVLLFPIVWRRSVLWAAPLLNPIKWNFDGFLGANRMSGQTYVTVFQIAGENIRQRSVEIRDATLQSNITGEHLAVTFKTSDGYVKAADLNPIPGRTKFNAHALFYDPTTRKPGVREGLPEEEFLSRWGEFEFTYTTPTRTYRRRFTNKEILLQIERVKPSPIAIRRLTRKPADPSSTVTQKQGVYVKYGIGDPSVFEGEGVSSVSDNGVGDFTINFSEPLDKNRLTCQPVGATPRDFQVVAFTPESIRIAFREEPRMFHLRFSG